MTIWNMARWHREFQFRLNDAKKLRLYAQLAALQHQALNTSLAKAESSSKHWEQKVKDGAKRIMRADKKKTRLNMKPRWLN